MKSGQVIVVGFFAFTLGLSIVLAPAALSCCVAGCLFLSLVFWPADSSDPPILVEHIPTPTPSQVEVRVRYSSDPDLSPISSRPTLISPAPDSTSRLLVGKRVNDRY